MPIFRLFVLAGLLGCVAGSALAAEPAELSGTPAILPSGVIMVEGHDVTLWGIDTLAADQECWHDERAWDCGEQALLALRHHLAGHPIRCVIKAGTGGNKISAQCFRNKEGKEDDIAHYLVIEGWARNAASSNGLYASEEEHARESRRGIWTSRFQTAEDWKNGIPHYIEYQDSPPKPALPMDMDNSPQDQQE